MTSDSGAESPARRLRIRNVLMVGLTVLTGATDAIAFIRLGGVFSSVMTGNIVLVGVAVGRGTYTTLARTAVAIGAYIVGSLVGGRAVGSHQKDDGIWPAVMTTALLVESGLLLAFAVIWWTNLGRLGNTDQSVLLAICSAALGLQSSAILRLGVPGLSTTYLTGTLTTLVHNLAVRGSVRGHGRSLAILGGLILGAAAGALAARFTPALAAAIPLVVAVTVVVAGRIFLTTSS